MPPRKKTKNQTFEIHRDESCLSSNASVNNSNNYDETSAVSDAVLNDDVPEHGQVTDNLYSNHQDPTTSIYSDPGEPGYSRLALEEILEVTEPDITGYTGQLEVQTRSHYEPRSPTENNYYDEQSASEYTEGLSEEEADHTETYHHDKTTPDSRRMAQDMDSECSLMNHSIDQSYNAEGVSVSAYEVTDNADLSEPPEDRGSTPRRRQRDPSSSPHEPEDDVFSDRSLRSSNGSYDGGVTHKNLEVEEATSINESSLYKKHRSPDLSDSELDNSSASRRTPRANGRSTGPEYSYRKGHVSTGSASSRSSKRGAMTKIGNNFPVQYSPKNRTPNRFRPEPDAAPLVLLHATMLPLQWNWAEVVEDAAAQAIEGKVVLSDAVKNLRDAWSLLVDRIGDTVLERGVLLSHPQNDFEVLEERILEAMELPLRRRARILECGHYLGPANYVSLSDDEETDFEDSSFASYEAERRKATSTRHWCTTCRDEIRVDALGSGKIFRVKVYASNGLMRAGAWEACWKEMERVDVEIEPVVDSAMHIELAELLTEKEKREVEEVEKKEVRKAEQIALAKIDEVTRNMIEERERLKEVEAQIKTELELLREVRETPTAVTHPTTIESDTTRTSMVSEPNVTTPKRELPDSFAGLLWEACRVALMSKKNWLILILGGLVVFLALQRPARLDGVTHYDEYLAEEIPAAVVETEFVKDFQEATHEGIQEEIYEGTQDEIQEGWVEGESAVEVELMAELEEPVDTEVVQEFEEFVAVDDQERESEETEVEHFEEAFEDSEHQEL